MTIEPARDGDHRSEPGPALPGGARAPRLGDDLARNRHALAMALAKNLEGWEKYADQIAADPDLFARRELYAFVDYLSLYFRTGDDAYKSLYVGEKLKQLYVADEGRAARIARAARLLEADEGALIGGLEGRARGDLGPLRRTLGEIRAIVLSEAPRVLEVLFVGDCLHLDIQAFLASASLEDGIAIEPTFLTSKNGVLLRNELRATAGRAFDLIFYSPFSYAFSPPMAATLGLRRALDGRARIGALVAEAMADAGATLDLLASRFDGTILVHNTANIRRHDGSPADRIKGLLTRRCRRIARDLVNARLAEAIERANAATFEHLFLLDELPLLEAATEDELGRMFYDSDLQHPAVMGRALADRYRAILAAHAGLAGRKLVVCDLDNTLWAGEIGEGAVAHFLDRQAILRGLREKGIVLAINSKNDPKNVRWEGALLGEDDFVHREINWDSKVANMRRIREALNLKYKDYVFVDDRADQLAMMAEALPEVRSLDATDGRTWKLLEAWGAMLPRPTEGDRTRLYRDRQAREEFVGARAEEDQAALFANLGIRLTIREAARPDLPRVAELINRTNQFNLAGTRTTFGEVDRWAGDPACRLVVVEASDKFGPMGLICATLFRREGDALQIPAFVLSCRVFGYGIEKAVIGLAKRLAEDGDDGRPLAILGAYKETSHNAPCRSMYPDLGFAWDGNAWAFRGGAIEPDEPWLTIDDRVAPAARRATA